MYKTLKISDSTLQQCLTVELVSAVWCKGHAVIHVLVDKKESVRNVYKCLCRVYGTDNVTCTKLTEEFNISMPPLTKLYEIETQYLKSTLQAGNRRGMIISFLSE
jgi:hypothetical protein